MSRGQMIVAAKNPHGIQALNVAEGGIRFAVATSLAADSDFTDNIDLGPITLFPGAFTFHYLSKTRNFCAFEATGTVQGVNRTVRTGFKKGSGGLRGLAQDYVIYWGGSGGGTSTLGNNVVINGDILSNGNLNLNNALVSGDVYSTGNLTGTSGVQGTYEAHVATPEGQPSLETTYYDNQILIAQNNPTYTGSHTFSGSLSPGAYYVRGNVTLGSLTLTGVTTIVATGTITVGNNETIGDNFTAIASREINIGNNNNIGNNANLTLGPQMMDFNGIPGMALGGGAGEFTDWDEVY